MALIALDKQALIKDKRNPNLYLLAASQTKDKNVLTEDAVGRVLNQLKDQFDYIVCDSPAGIESGEFSFLLRMLKHPYISTFCRLTIIDRKSTRLNSSH